MKIFNKIRFKMIEGKRLKNYLIYAFGEIILVIIGILFALGINNWNQNRQLRNANVDLQKKVVKQLDKDIKFLENFQDDLEDLNQTYLKVLGRDYDKSKVHTGSMVSTVLFSVNTLSLDNHLNNLIDNATLDDSEASTQLIELNSTYKLYLRDIADIEAVIYEKMKNNLLEIEKSQSWYTELITDFTCQNECINYILQDEGHKSRIATLRFLYANGYGRIIKGFHDDLIAFKSTFEEDFKSSSW